MSRRTLGTALAAAVALVVTGCTPTGDDGPRAASPAPSRSTSASSPSTSASVASPTAGREAAPAETLPAEAAPPRDGACYRLDFEEATAPTASEDPVSCRRRHTSQTYHVGRLETVVDGHLLAVDSRLAQEQVRDSCTRRLSRHLGGSPRDRRLSRLRPVWFSPTLEQSDLGASWFRCDVVALGRGSTLAPLPTRTEGVLDRPGGLDQVGLCGTSAPGARGFERVICSRPHTWRALTTIDIDGETRYPGVSAVRRAGEERCRDAVRRASGSPERFRYGWEWPTREQWRDGQRFGYCWMPA